MKKSSHKGVYWKSQLPVDYVDTSLVQNTWENVSADLSGGKPARMWYIIVEQTNNGATAETIELEITFNGVARTITFTDIDSGVPNYAYCRYFLAAGDFAFGNGTQITTTNAQDADQAIPFSTDSIGLIRVRQTTDVDGVSAQIEVNIVWDRLEP